MDGILSLKNGYQSEIKEEWEISKNMSPVQIINQTAKEMISSMWQRRYMHGVKRKMRR